MVQKELGLRYHYVLLSLGSYHAGENEDLVNTGRFRTRRNSSVEEPVEIHQSGDRFLKDAVQQHNEHIVTGICKSDWMYPNGLLVVLECVVFRY